MYRRLIFLLGALAAATASAGVVPPFTATTGSSFVVDFNGFVNNPSNVIDGLTAQVTYSDFAFTPDPAGNRTIVTFQVSIFNNSSLPVTDSRVSALGFNTSPTILSNPGKNKKKAPRHTVTGVFNTVTLNGNSPNGLGLTEFCFSDGNCAGGANGGVNIGETGVAYATLYFAAGTTAITFDDLYVRYQSIEGINCITSASGLPVANPVPEPGQYFVLLSSIGLYSLRRRFRQSSRRP